MNSCYVKTVHKWTTVKDLHIQEGEVTVHQVVQKCDHCDNVRTLEERYGPDVGPDLPPNFALEGVVL